MRNSISYPYQTMEAFTAEQNDEMLDANVSDTISLWSSFEKCPEGAIIERRGRRFNERRV